MASQFDETHQDRHKGGTWERIRPQDPVGWLYWIVAIVVAVLVIGGILLYVPALFADRDPDSTSMLMQAGFLLLATL